MDCPIFDRQLCQRRPVGRSCQHQLANFVPQSGSHLLQNRFFVFSQNCHAGYHATIAAFRRRFLLEIEKLFVQVLLLAREIGVLKLGTIGLDGTKIHVNASRP